MDITSLIRTASVAMCVQKFREADDILQNGLCNSAGLEEKELILQSLVHLYSHPLNKDLGKAQAFMDKREYLSPSADTALSGAYFSLYTKQDKHSARQWAEIALHRALSAQDWFVFYSASGIVGLVAIQDGDRAATLRALKEMESVIERAVEVSYGDNVPFLELLVTDNDLADEARKLAGLIAPRIEDADFRARAEAIAKRNIPAVKTL